MGLSRAAPKSSKDREFEAKMVDDGHESITSIMSGDSSSSFSFDDVRMKPNPYRTRPTSYQKPGVLSPEDYGYGEVVEQETTAPALEDPSGYGDMRAKVGLRIGQRSTMKQGGARRSTISFRGEITNTLPSGRKEMRRQSICFDDSLTEIRHVEPTKNLAMNPEELWFQEPELKLIRENAIMLTNLAKSTGSMVSLESNSKLCLRGLESHIDSDCVEQEQHMAWKSVFLEQYVQMAESDFNEDAVANLYEMASMPARVRALKRAEDDEVEADKHTRTICRRYNRRHSTM